MAAALADIGNAIVDVEDAFERELQACQALAELTLPIWQSHPRALDGFVTKLVLHEKPGGRALALIGASFMPGKVGEVLADARLALLKVGRRAGLPVWTHLPTTRPDRARFLLTEEADESRSPGLYCLFERGGAEFGWFLGFDQDDCGIPVAFQPIPTRFCADLTRKVLNRETAGGLHDVRELSEPEGRWLLESSLTALETHAFKFSDANEELVKDSQGPILRERIAYTALLRWYLHEGPPTLARPLPKHGGHLPFQPW